MSSKNSINGALNLRLRVLVDVFGGGKPTKFADDTGIPQGTFFSYLKGRVPNSTHLLKIREAHLVNIDWLLTGEGEMYIKDHHLKTEMQAFDLVPLVQAQLNAGGGFEVLGEEVVSHYAFKKSWLRHNTSELDNAVLMMVGGDSMEPTIADGDCVLVDEGRKKIKPGGIFALGVDDTIIIKRLDLLAGDRVRVISDNKVDYREYEADLNDVRVIGQVVWIGRQLLRM